MTARMKLAEPPRLFQIEEVIRRMLFKDDHVGNSMISDKVRNSLSENMAKQIVNELLDQHLIGLPSGNAARTSVDCSLVAQLGEKLACRKGDDADDVLRTAIRVGVIVG